MQQIELINLQYQEEEGNNSFSAFFGSAIVDLIFFTTKFVLLFIVSKVNIPMLPEYVTTVGPLFVSGKGKGACILL